jgi:predicted RNA-binding protein
MSNTLEIPAARIPGVRDGLLCLLGDAAEAVNAAVDRRDRELHPEWFVPARDLFERACALLDQIGWDGTLQPQATRIDLDEHGCTLQEAVEVVLEVAETDVEEADLTDRERAERGEPSRRDQFEHRLVGLQVLLTVVRGWSKAG